MTLNPFDAYEQFSADQIAKAKARNPKLRYLVETAVACDVVGLPFWLGVALYDKETGSFVEQNIFGHDSGGAMYGKGLVTEEKYREFKRLIDGGKTSNGVGPLQATWKPHFATMEGRGLKPWLPADSMLYLIGVFASYLTGDKMKPTDAAIKKAGTKYNGSTAYGDRLLALAKSWRQTVGEDPVIPVPPPPPGPVPTDGKTSFRGGYACPCMILIIPVIEARLKLAGIIKYSIDFAQLAYSFATQSRGIHAGGGSFDTKAQFSPEACTIFRECGVDYHHRKAIPGVWYEHGHGLVRGCPHRSPAADAQVALFVKGYDGLVGNHPYRGPAPKKVGSWKDGYAKYKHLLDPPVPVPPVPPVDPPVYIGPYWVNPANVQTVLKERKISDPTVVVAEHKPRTKISNGIEIVTIDGAQHLRTDAETRLAMEYLTATEPVVEPPPPDPKPEGDVERVLCFNMRRSTAPGDNPPWSARKAKAFQLIKDADCSLLFLQESHPPDQRPPGYSWYSIGNVAVGWRTSVWKKVSSFRVNMKSGSDDRESPVAVLEHIKTGHLWHVSSLHLTNLEGPDHGDGWRLGQSAEWVAQVRQKAPKMFTERGMVGGDFNDNAPVLAFFKMAGFLELLDKTEDYPGGSGSDIDNILTTADGKVVRAGVLSTKKRGGPYFQASDHNAHWAEVLA